MSPVRRPSRSSVDGLRAAVAAPAVPVAVPEPAQPEPRWTARIQLTTTPEMKTALDLARVGDGIGVTERIRAMITLWQNDPELRDRVDELARSLH